MNLCVCVCVSLSVVSDSLWPCGLYSPWNSPGQNTGVGKPFLSPNPKLCITVNTWVTRSNKMELCMDVCSVSSDSFSPRGLEPIRLLCPWDSPSKNIGVSCHALFQGIFPTQALNPGLLYLLHCRSILYPWATWEAHKVIFEELFKQGCNSIKLKSLKNTY